MTRAVVAAFVVAGAALCIAGCRATPAAPADDMALDMGVESDMGDGDDLAAPDLATCPMGPEVCGNGCDDDRNGYTDDDDPACTTQMLVTLSVSTTPALWRLILEPTPHVVALDGNPVGKGGMATYNRAFTDAAFVAYDGNTKELDRIALGGGAKTTLTPAPMFGTRDVCVFNGEVIVVEPKNLGAGSGLLHRFSADGMTELMPSVPVPNIASACATDGTQLYVAEHPAAGESVLAVFDKGANGPVYTNVTLTLPDSLLQAGYARLVDFAYVKKTGLFIGIFSTDLATVDSGLDGQVMAPFGPDGGVGSWIDGGLWHGVGEFVP